MLHFNPDGKGEPGLPPPRPEQAHGLQQPLPFSADGTSSNPYGSGFGSAAGEASRVTRYTPPGSGTPDANGGGKAHRGSRGSSASRAAAETGTADASAVTARAWADNPYREDCRRNAGRHRGGIDRPLPGRRAPRNLNSRIGRGGNRKGSVRYRESSLVFAKRQRQCPSIDPLQGQLGGASLRTSGNAGKTA